LENGTKVAQFSIATTESYKDKAGNWQDQTEWHNIVVWRWLADKAENSLKKGSKVYIEGKTRTRSWTDKDNNTRYTTEILGEKLLPLDKREGGNGNYPPPVGADDIPAAQEKPTNENATKEEPNIKTSDPEDDLPF
jgi:single-strand DNA-binding protein